MFDEIKNIEKKEALNSNKENNFNINNFFTAKFKNLSSGKPKLAALAPLTPAISDLENRIRKLEEKGRKRGKRYSKIGIISSFIIALAVMAAGYYILTEIIKFTGETNEIIGNLSDMNKQSNSRLMIKSFWRQCASDEDCLVTRKDCCVCENGGTQSAINKKSIDLWESELKIRCQNKTCTAAYSCQEGLPICKNGRCVFVKSGNISPQDEDIPADSAGSSDIDKDGLSDAEEIKYGTKIDNPDTDADGFSDGEEINKGYNPVGVGVKN